MSVGTRTVSGQTILVLEEWPVCLRAELSRFDTNDSLVVTIADQPNRPSSSESDKCKALLESVQILVYTSTWSSTRHSPLLTCSVFFLRTASYTTSLFSSGENHAKRDRTSGLWPLFVKTDFLLSYLKDPESILVRRGFESTTFCALVRCLTNWTNQWAVLGK